MPWCEQCGEKAPPEIHELLNESDYTGEYFCSDECRDIKRAREELHEHY